MEKSKRKYSKFSKQEKLQILKEAQEKGVKVTLSKYNVYPATYYNWKKHAYRYTNSDHDIETVKSAQKEIKRLEQELQHYKNMLAEEQLKGRLKDEMLKKKYPKLS